MKRPTLAVLAALSLVSLPGCSLFGASRGEAAPTPEASPRQSAGGGGAAARRGGGGGAGSEPRPYDEVVTEEAITRRGFLTTHRIDDALHFEVPPSALGVEMLLLARPVESTLQSDAGFFGGGARLIVQWERHGDRIVLREKAHDVMATDTAAAIWRQVRGFRNGPVLDVFPVEAYNPSDSAAVIDVTGLFLSGNERIGAIQGFQRDKSWIDHAAAFPRNVEVEATQTGSVRPNGAPPSARPQPQTQRVHWSLLALPADPMMPRLHDRRVGFNSFTYRDYSRREHRSEELRLVRRFRLEPSDSAAFRRGELVEPVEPIVYWIDPATPDWLKPWVKKGVDAWQGAFEQAGFRNAIRGEFAPAGDPDWSLFDARRSVIYWRPSSVPNATGGQVYDPRTGEILKGEVNMYHNVMNLLRNWYFTQVSPLDPRAQDLPMPDSLMGRLVEYVVTHEVGHSIGFPHNMKASAMYPADSLRSESFLRRMGGHVATLMDYSRFNYVVQPEDGVDPDLLVPNVGPYDRFAVEWGYRPFLDARTPEEERPYLERLARRQDTIPWLRFTTSDAPNDPAALTEAVGDEDAMKSSRLGLRNLERVVDMLIPVAEQPGRDYDLLDELYGNAVSQWSRYMGHVAAVVGGANTQERYGTGVRFEPVPEARQREAMAFLNERAFRTPEMFLRPEILRRIEAEGVVDRIRVAQRNVLRALLSQSRMDRMIEYEALASRSGDAYTIAEMMADLRSGVWTELRPGPVRVDVYRRALQRSYLERVDELLNPDEEDGPRSPFAPPPPTPSESDMRPVLRGELVALRTRVEAARPRAADDMTRLHLQDVRMEIDRILDTPR